MKAPSYLFVELPNEHAEHEATLERIAGMARAGGGSVLACEPAGRVTCLEPGTVAAGIMLARWSKPDGLVETSEQVTKFFAPLATQTAHPLVLQVTGLPEAGLPEMMDIPTVASVPTPPPLPRNALMIVRGTVFDQPRLDKYRDVILPMLKARGGYYEVFALESNEVRVLMGEWTEQIFAVSRWPHAGAASEFWYSERYQSQAIPLRLGAGRFSVHLLDASEDPVEHSATTDMRNSNVEKADAKSLGLAFLQSFWDGEPERGFALCAPNATWRFQRSLHEPQEVPVREAVEWLLENLVSGFDPDSGYTVNIANTIADGNEAAIEYSATGKTKRGEIYLNRYLVRFTVGDSKILSIRPYFDTHYVSKTLHDLG